MLVAWASLETHLIWHRCLVVSLCSLLFTPPWTPANVVKVIKLNMQLYRCHILGQKLAK